MALLCAEYIVEFVASFISVGHCGRPLGLPSLYLCSIACCGMLSGGSLLMCANHLICWLLIYSRIGAVPVLCLMSSFLTLSLSDIPRILRKHAISAVTSLRFSCAVIVHVWHW